MKKAVRYGMVMLSCVQLFSFAHASIPERPQGGYVSDFASVLTPSERQNLESEISLYNASTSNEIAVVIVKSLDGDYIEHYASTLFEKWGIGSKKHDNGVLLLIALDDHQMRIEVGYGLEGALTDSISSGIIRNDLAPPFKQGDYYGGITKAVNDIIKVTQGEYVATKEDASEHVSIGGSTLLFILFALLQFLSAIFGRSKSWWAGGVVGGILGGAITWIFGVALVYGGIMTLVLVLLGLLFDYIVSAQYAKAVASGSKFPWWIGGGGFGGGSGSSSFSSGGSSFGGFGGGRSGGGGASGSW